MKILIAEDDLVSRKFLFKFLSAYGDCDITVDGIEALDAFLMAWDEGKPYELICLDIMMPRADGLKVLSTIRHLEDEKGVRDQDRAKVIMTTVLNDTETVQEAFNSGCEAYASKPIDTKKLLEVMQKMELVS